MTWYEALAKPTWTPSPSFIGTMWTILYPIIVATFGYMVFRMTRGTVPWAVLTPMAINAVANAAFTPIEFGLRNLPLASVDILVVLATILWCMAAFWPYSRWASVALLPYLGWVSTATVLQLSITWMNR